MGRWLRRRWPGEGLGLLLCLLLPLQAGAAGWPPLATLLGAPGDADGMFQPELRRFYAARDYRPIWFRSAEPTSAAGQLLDVLDNAAFEGLSAGDYQPAALRRDCLAGPMADPAACELRMSRSLLRYASDVGYGLLNAADVDPHWHLPQARLDAAALLQRVAKRQDIAALLAGLPPAHPQYRRLRAALAMLRSQREGWFVLPDGPSLKPGVRSGQVLALRERLGSEVSALLTSDAPSLYDARLREAVEGFQARHGLDVDGIVGPKTRAAMNVPLEDRITQLRLNMERWRWLPRQLGDEHVLVNLAGFDLTLVAEGRPALRMRAISGRPDRTSPSFGSEIRQLVLNPSWTVPRRLAVEDLLPMLQRDPLSLRRKAIHILRREGGQLVEVDPLSVDWRRHDKNNFPYVLRQEPGARNSLGRLKFVLPNPFDIFIHDTPHKGLFAKSVRTLSSGCIRVERPIELAARLMGGEPAGGEAWLRQRLADNATEFLPVSPAVPVYLVYLTAWVDDAGNLQLRDDVYGRDLPMYDRFSLQ